MSDLSVKQLTALCLLLSGYQNQEVADRTGVSLSTIEKWKRQPNFEKEMKDAACKIYECAIAELATGASKAVRELLRMVDDKNVPDRTKIQAITLLLNHLKETRDWQLEKRLEALEATLNGGSRNGSELKAINSN